MDRWQKNVIRGERELGTLPQWGDRLVLVSFPFFFLVFFWFLVFGFLSAFAFALLLSLGGAKPTGGWPAEGDD